MKLKSTTQLKSYVGDIAVQDGNAVQGMKARVHLRRAHNPEQSHD